MRYKSSHFLASVQLFARFFSFLRYNLLASFICSIFVTELINRRIMIGTVLTPRSPITLQYWEMLKGLSSTVKMELAAMLTTSLAYKGDVVVESEMTEEERKQELLSLAGCWADDPEDAARMEAAIKDGRKNVFMREINLDD
jgi:hypothetical protein